MKIISGVYQPTRGTMVYKGKIHQHVDASIAKNNGVHAPTLSSGREDDHHRCAWLRNGLSFGKSRWLYTPASLIW